MFSDFDFRGCPFYKNTPILTFDFHPYAPSVGTPGALRGNQIKKLHKTFCLPRFQKGMTPFFRVRA